jgi:hypothetical protein
LFYIGNYFTEFEKKLLRFVLFTPFQSLVIVINYANSPLLEDTLEAVMLISILGSIGDGGILA